MIEMIEMISYMTQYVTAFLSRNMLVTLTILTVLVIRYCIRRLPKKYSYALWGVVGVRMLFDIRIPSALSILNLFQRISWQQSAKDTQQIRQLKESVNLALRPAASGGQNLIQTVLAEDVSLVPQQVLTENAYAVSEGAMLAGQTGQSMAEAAAGSGASLGMDGWISLIWLMGAAAMILYAVFSYRKVKRKVRFSTPMKKEQGVYESDRVGTAFILGIVTPKIYVPYGLKGQELEYVLCHERCHIRRRDTWFKALAFLLLCLYWCNPLAWLSFYLFGLDMEMSCDEAVLSCLGEDIKKRYSLSLLSLAAGKNDWLAVPLGFGESDAGKRIRHVLDFKKPKGWMHLIAFLTVLAMLPVCLTGAADGAGRTGEGDAEIPVALHRNINAHLRQVGPAGGVAVTDQGLYFAEQISIKNGARSGYRILYFDGSTKETYLVCSDPDCTHDSSICDAVYGLDKGDAGQSAVSPLGVYGDRLYVLVSALTDSTLSLYCSDLYGRDRELLWQHRYESDNPAVADRVITASNVLWDGSRVFVEYSAEDHVQIEAGDGTAGGSEAVSAEVTAHGESGILSIDLESDEGPVKICEESTQYRYREADPDGQGKWMTFQDGFVSMMAVRDGSVYYRHLEADEQPDWEAYPLWDSAAPTEQWNSSFTGQVVAAAVQEDQVSEEIVIDLGQAARCISAYADGKIYYQSADSVLEYDLETGETAQILALEGTAASLEGTAAALEGTAVLLEETAAALEGAVLEDVFDGWVICRNYEENRMIFYSPETGQTLAKEAFLGDNLYGSVTLDGQTYWFMRAAETDPSGDRTYQWYLVERESYLTEENPERIILAER